MTISKEASRITVVDALRGFALVSIMLLHNIEMFEVHAGHPALPEWMLNLDKIIWDTFFFLFGGKSYAIFALLFGLTFYIQSNNQNQKGKDFHWRFIWRLVLLLGFGFVNTLFYRGEILVLYALVGLFLVGFTKVSNRTLMVFAIILLFQPILLSKLWIAVHNPSLPPAEPLFLPFYIKSGPYLTGGSFIELMKSNITDGRMASMLWYWEYGRIEQTLALFLLGLWAGRKQLFHNTIDNKRFWKRTLLVSALTFIPLYILKSNPDYLSDSQGIAKALGGVIAQWSNLAFMLVLTSAFILLFHNKKTQPIFNWMSPIGKMSLSNYILQSMVGATLYYGFGLALYHYVGSSYCLLIGIVLTVCMALFSRYWMKHHKRGILESVWHKLTWAGSH